MTDGAATERKELALQRCSDPLHAAADTLAEGGHTPAAAALRTLAEADDLDRTAAKSLLDLQGLDPDERDLAINSVADVCRVMMRNGERTEPAVLVEWLEGATALFGFPGEDDESDE